MTFAQILAKCQLSVCIDLCHYCILPIGIEEDFKVWKDGFIKQVFPMLKGESEDWKEDRGPEGQQVRLCFVE